MKDIIAEFTKKMEEYERNERKLRLLFSVMALSGAELEKLSAYATELLAARPSRAALSLLDSEPSSPQVPPHPFHGNVVHDIVSDEPDSPVPSTTQHYVSLCGDFKHPNIANVHKHEGHCKKCKAIVKASTPKKYVSLVVEEIKTSSGTVFWPPCGKPFASKASAQAHMGRCKECRKAVGAPIVRHRPRRRTTTCRICNRKFKGNAGLGLHLRKTHGMSYVEYDASYAGYGEKHK